MLTNISISRHQNKKEQDKGAEREILSELIFVQLSVHHEYIYTITIQ